MRKSIFRNSARSSAVPGTYSGVPESGPSPTSRSQCSSSPFSSEAMVADAVVTSARSKLGVCQWLLGKRYRQILRQRQQGRKSWSSCSFSCSTSPDPRNRRQRMVGHRLVAFSKSGMSEVCGVFFGFWRNWVNAVNLFIPLLSCCSVVQWLADRHIVNRGSPEFLPNTAGKTQFLL